MQTLIALENITYKRGKRIILNAVNLHLNRGEITALIGRNGVGKTTLLSITAGLLTAQQGQCHYPQQKPRIAWLGDKPALYPDWTVGMLLAWQMEKHQANLETLAQTITQCQLESVLNTPCKALSHGYRQRTALAQALLSKPDVLLADEPGNGLDAEQKQSLRNILRQTAQNAGILMIHHNIDEVLTLADRIYYLENTSVQEIPLPPRDLYWCEWRTAQAAACAPEAIEHIGCFSAHRTLLPQMMASSDLLRFTQNLPIAVFTQYRKDHEHQPS